MRLLLNEFAVWCVGFSIACLRDQVASENMPTAYPGCRTDWPLAAVVECVSDSADHGHSESLRVGLDVQAVKAFVMLYYGTLNVLTTRGER
jgi:hypothetical protein